MNDMKEIQSEREHMCSSDHDSSSKSHQTARHDASAQSQKVYVEEQEILSKEKSLRKFSSVDNLTVEKEVERTKYQNNNDVTTENMTEGTLLEDLVKDATPAKPKSSGKNKKRVSFEPDESLVRVQEIPRYSPALTEELEPCDPERLAAQMGALKIVPVEYSLRSNTVSSSDIYSQLNKMRKCGVVTSGIPDVMSSFCIAQKKELTDRSRKPKIPCVPKLKPNDFRSQFNSGKDYKMKHLTSGYNKDTAFQNAKTCQTNMKKAMIIKTSNTGKRQLGLGLDTHSNHGNKGQIKLYPGNGSNLRIGSASAQLRHQNSLDSVSSLPRIHRSPYRRSSAPPGRFSGANSSWSASTSGGVLQTKSANTDDCTSNGSKSAISISQGEDLATLAEATILQTVPPSPDTGRDRKVYAWNMANGDLGHHHQMTPCISQMWEPTRVQFEAGTT